jgi:uncharacterized membrane protein YtjA (UPF0391 family)
VSGVPSFKENPIMFRIAVLFLVIALIAGLLGYGLVADYSWETGKIVFFVFLVLAALSFLGGAFRRRSY